MNDMKHTILSRGCGLLLLLGAAPGLLYNVQAERAAKLPPAATRENVSFEKDILPLFERSCTKCHGPEKQKGKLRLDSREAVLRGAEDGKKVVKPGNSAKSQIVLNVAHATDDEDEWMPPEGKAEPLTAEEIGLLRAWIDQGAR